MLSTNELFTRDKAGYVGTYDYLNPKTYLGDAVVEMRRVTNYNDNLPEDSEEEYDECDPIHTAMLVRVKLEDPQPEERIKRALYDSFTYAGCHHDWDCCGCRSIYTREVKHLREDLWWVETNSSRNY